MTEKKRIKTLQRIVGQLQVEKQQLFNENQKLQERIDLEINKQNESQETQKQLEIKLQKCIDKYQQLIVDTQLIKTKYEEETNKIKKLKSKYSKKMKTIIKSIKKDF